MDRELSGAQIRKSQIKKIARGAVVLLAFIASVFLIRGLLRSSLKSSQILVATAEIGDIEGALTASGIVVPEFEQLITSPIESKIEQVFYHPGETVHQDSSILELNKKAILNQLEQQKDELALKVNRKKQLKLKIERSLIDLNAQYDISKLNIKYLESKVDVQKHMNEIGVGIQEELNQAVLNLEIARRELDQLEQRIKNEKESLDADLTELELEIRIEEKTINNLERQLALADVKPNKPGVVTWINDDIGATVHAGDIIARVADLRSFKVEGKISDIHASKIMVGNPVRVRIGEQNLKGIISGIQPTIQNGIITFSVRLEDKTNRELRSNMRVDIFVITSFKSGIVRVKNGPFVNGSGEQDIFILNGKTAVRRRALIGDSNFDWVEIKEGVQPGDKVIISDMERYIHRATITIKD